jgi:hypothetical protein
MSGLRIKDIKAEIEEDKTSSSIVFDKMSKHVLEYNRNKQEAHELAKKMLSFNEPEKVHSIQEIIAQLPEGAEFIELCIDGEETITKAMLDKEKAGENMKIDQNLVKQAKNLRNQPKRTFTTVFRHGETEFTIADDGTAWLLDRGANANPVWMQMFDVGYPELPQD